MLTPQLPVPVPPGCPECVHMGVRQRSLQFRAIEHNVNFWARFGRDNHHYHDQSRSKCAYATPIERNNPQEYDSDGSKHWS